MAILREHSDAECAAVRTWDESMQLCDIIAPANAALDADLSSLFKSAQASADALAAHESDHTLLHRLNVAGEMFGCAVLSFASPMDAARRTHCRLLLNTWCEELDNYLAAIARARKKHQVTLALSAALKNPVLEVGASEAVAVLLHEVRFTDLLLAYVHETDRDGESLNYHFIKNGEVLFDSFAPDRRLNAEQRAGLFAYVRGEQRNFPEQFGFSAYREDVLINGMRDEHVVGCLLIANTSGEFNTFDRDLLERFADYVRQRVVDFKREWKGLSQTFSRRDSMRLLAEEDYVSRYLQPRERDVAVMFCDISGFTRLSEQVLKKPNLIGQLIDTWSAEVVRILWRTDAVFDKMVGDCIIGLWGPPVFDLTPADACSRALDAAVQIREYTARLSDDLPAIADADFPFGVATGFNYCPLFVGTFGPDEDYTGFSSGMNNTARLQGVAACNEILCMDDMAARVTGAYRFSDVAEERVKNVASPLRFRRLLD